MDNCLLQPQRLFLPQTSMNPFSLSSKLAVKLKPTLTFFSKSLSFNYFCSATQHVHNSIEVLQPPSSKPSNSSTTISKTSLQNLKEDWLSSLSINGNKKEGLEGNNGLEWFIGVDPDASGALALLKYDHSGCISSEVFDSPYVQVPVGKTRRKRLDARSIIQLLQRIDVPIGTNAYLEQSIPFPQDGKLGWWNGGFNYGLWIGILVASGFNVVPVPSASWKKEFELARSNSSKDDSRELAARLFPDLSPMLKRKKDHGRAEALLIAAYGRGLKLKEDELTM